MLQDLNECQKMKNRLETFVLKVFKRFLVFQRTSLNVVLVEVEGVEPEVFIVKSTC